MKLAFIADLHVDAGSLGRAAAGLLPYMVENAKPEVFIIGGDVAARLYLIEQFLAGFSDLNCPKLFVPGNHDIWVASPKELDHGITTPDKYHRLLPDICRSAGFHYLPGDPLVINGVGFAGTLGWYDYSFRNHALDHLISERIYRRKHYQGLVWNDRRYAKWGISDREVAHKMAFQLDSDIAQIEPKSEKIVVISHHLPFEQMVRRTGKPEWDFFNAFMGSALLGETITKHPKATLVLAGHTHHKSDTTLEGIRAIASPLGYTREHPEAPEKAISESLLTVTIEAYAR